MKFEKAKERLLGILIEESVNTGHSVRTLILELMKAHNEHCSEFTRTPGEPNETNLLKLTNKRLILDSLHRNKWNQRAASKELGIPKSTLNDWIKRWKGEQNKLSVVMHG